jgi:predicted nucleic acid-binding protein
MAPDLLYSEFGNIVWKIHRRGVVEAGDALEIVSQFQMLPIDIHPTERLLPMALEIAITSDRTVYDSMYLALGVLLETPVITADMKFYKGITDAKLRKFVKLL